MAATRRVMGGERSNMLVAMNNLAWTMRAQGELDGARAMQEQVLAVLRRVLGEEHLNTLVSMNNLALTMEAQGDLAGEQCARTGAGDQSPGARGGASEDAYFHE